MKYQMPDGMASEPVAALDGLAPGAAAADDLALGVAARVVVALDDLAPGVAVPGASNVCGRPWHGLSRAPETILLLPVFLLYTPLLPPLFSYPAPRYPARLKCQVLFLSPETSIPGNSPA